VDVADWKVVWNVRQSRYEDMNLIRKDGTFGWFVKDIFDTYGVEGLSHIQENPSG
jgi:hypothetical protein